MEQNDKQLLRSSKQIIRELQSDLASERQTNERLQLSLNQLMTQYNNLNTDYQTDHAKFDSTVKSLRSALEN